MGGGQRGAGQRTGRRRHAAAGSTAAPFRHPCSDGRQNWPHQGAARNHTLLQSKKHEVSTTSMKHGGPRPAARAPGAVIAPQAQHWGAAIGGGTELTDGQAGQREEWQGGRRGKAPDPQAGGSTRWRSTQPQRAGPCRAVLGGCE
jgi:hypothetical protein